MRCENAGATESSEDYLEAILVIRAERGFCRNVDIAERLGVCRFFDEPATPRSSVNAHF